MITCLSLTPPGYFTTAAIFVVACNTMTLLEEYGMRTTERTLSLREFLEADEIFSTGNYSKVVPVTRIEERELQPGPVARKARKLYWEWAHSS